jgi:hypothetical protein
VTSLVTTPARRRGTVSASSHTSTEPHGRHRKSSAPQSRSWRAGMQGSDPTWWFGEPHARRAKRSRFGVGELRAAVAAQQVAVQAVEQHDDDVAGVDADGIFRRAMRELEVPFLHRWVMWAAVRWGALVKPGGRDGWGDEAALVLLVTALAFPLVAVPVAAVVIALVQLWVLELVTWVPLRLHAAWRRWRGRPVDKRVVFPHLDLGIGRHAAGPCPPPGWEGPPGPTSAGPGVGSGHDPTDPPAPR